MKKGSKKLRNTNGKLKQVEFIKCLPKIEYSLDILEIFGITLAIIAVLALFLYPPIAKQPQKLTDLYYDTLWTNGNKSGELHFLTFLTILGIALIAWFDTKRKPDPALETSIGEQNRLYFAIIAIPLMLHYFIYGEFPQFFLILGIIFVGVTFVRQQYALKAVFAYVFVYFACMGIFSFIKNDHVTERLVTVVSLFIYAPVLWKGVMNEKVLDKAILAAQIFIPLCLLIFLRNEFIADGQIIIIPFPSRYIAIIIAIITASMVYAVSKFVLHQRRVKIKEEESGLSLNSLILISTLCVIAAYRVDINLSRSVPGDFWHYGERVISWQQIIELGKVPYKEFFPPSGLFSIVNGFFLNTIFDGTASSIDPALTFEQVFYAFLIAAVLSFAAGPALAALLLFILPITGYERFHLIFLSLSILALPVVWKDINRWLKAWGLLVVANMLNYPLFGMALAIGGLPYAVCGIYLAVKQGKLIKWLRTPLFYVSWIAVFGVIIPFVPLVLRIVAASAISGGATVQAFGFALLSDLNVNIPVYWPVRVIQYTVILTAFSLAVMIPAYILLRVLRSPSISWEEKIAHPLFYFSTLGLFFLPAAYTFAIIQLSGGNVGRANGPIAIVLVLCIIAILKYAHPVFTIKEKLSFLVIIFSLALPFVWRHTSFQYINKIQVPDDYVRISGEVRTRLPRLGNGFIKKNDLNELEWYYSYLEKNNLFGLVGGGHDFYFGVYMYHYIFNIGAFGAASHWVAGGYKTSKLYYDVFKDKPYVGFVMNNGHSYTRTPNRYINYWLAIDKGVVQTPEGVWVSPEFVKEKYNPEDLKKPEFRADMGLYSAAYGRSMKSLYPIFERVKLINNINIGVPYPIGINGRDADFIYIELETNAMIKNKYFEPWDFTQYGIEFHFKHNGQWDGYALSYGDGHLLLPVGDDSRWLYENIEEIAVVLGKGFPSNSQGKIKRMELLKLKRNR